MMVQGPGTRTSRRRFLGAFGAATLGGAAGCLARGENSGLEGRITIDGSDTVLPHSAALAEEFQWRNNRVRIPVSGSGTGAGFRRFCADETDLQNASRAVKSDEEERCHANGVEFFEMTAVVDGIAVFVNPGNDWCDELTVEELRRIWQSGSDVETWADVRPGEGWPDEEIELYGRDTASGTFDYFTEMINGEAGNIRSDYSATSDTNVIVRGVRGDEHAIGWGGAGYYYENEGDLKLLGVDDGDGPVKPTQESIEAGDYTPLTRDMYTYVDLDALVRPEVQAFLRFYFEEIDDAGRETGEEIGIVEEGESLAWTQWAARRVGYYAIDDDVLEEQSNRLERAIEEVST